MPWSRPQSRNRSRHIFSSLSYFFLSIKGVFLLNPSSEISFVREITDGKQLLFVVYDINYTGSANQNLAFSSAKLIANEENTYDETSNPYATDFVTLSGYSSLKKMDEIPGGNSSPIRTVSVFAVNPNDIKENSSYTLNLDISEKISANISLSYEDIKEISLPDEIFSIEENPQAYQVARSVATRALGAKQTVSLWTKLVPAGSYSAIVIKTTPFFSDSSKFSVAATNIQGMNFSESINSENLKTLNIEDVKLYYPEIADEIEGLITCYKKIHVDKNFDADAVYAESNGYISTILEYFNINEFEFHSYTLYK